MVNHNHFGKDQTGEDPCDLHFESLCSMVDQLGSDQLPVNDANYLRRDYCDRCERPSQVCLCDHLPAEKINLKKLLKIWIFQHPKEEKRILRTTRILEKCLPDSNFEILKSKRFSVEKFPQLKEVYNNTDTYVLYPSDTSIDITDFRNLINDSSIKNQQKNSNETGQPNQDISNIFHLILIDGTWAQASGIYYTNKDLHKLKQIKIENIDFTSAYTIRTQPRDCFLSTLETCAIIISTIEENEQLYHDLVKPLKALCKFQFEHGAVPHQSKEYLLFNGLFKKPLSKKMFNKITKNSKFLIQDDLEVKTNYESALNSVFRNKTN